jgi:hypothetical protein
MKYFLFFMALISIAIVSESQCIARDNKQPPIDKIMSLIFAEGQTSFRGVNSEDSLVCLDAVNPEYFDFSEYRGRVIPYIANFNLFTVERGEQFWICEEKSNIFITNRPEYFSKKIAHARTHSPSAKANKYDDCMILLTENREKIYALITGKLRNAPFAGSEGQLACLYRVLFLHVGFDAVGQYPESKIVKKRSENLQAHSQSSPYFSRIDFRLLGIPRVCRFSSGDTPSIIRQKLEIPQTPMCAYLISLISSNGKDR